MIIRSRAKPVGIIPLWPEFTGIQVQMMEFSPRRQQLGKDLLPYKDIIAGLCKYFVSLDQKLFLTIDERELVPGETHRRAGAHIDGWYLKDPKAGELTEGWRPGGYWGTDRNPGITYDSKFPDAGMLIASNYPACDVWTGDVEGEVGKGGDCEHLRDQFGGMEKFTMPSDIVYATNAMCIHESRPVTKPVRRQLIRITTSNLPHVRNLFL
jgi:hypothetical protein